MELLAGLRAGDADIPTARIGMFVTAGPRGGKISGVPEWDQNNCLRLPLMATPWPATRWPVRTPGGSGKGAAHVWKVSHGRNPVCIPADNQSAASLHTRSPEAGSSIDLCRVQGSLKRLLVLALNIECRRKLQTGAHPPTCRRAVWPRPFRPVAALVTVLDQLRKLKLGTCFS